MSFLRMKNGGQWRFGLWLSVHLGTLATPGCKPSGKTEKMMHKEEPQSRNVLCG